MLLEIFGFLNLSFVDVLDILVVAVCLFAVFRWIKDSSAINIFIAILLLILVRIIAVALNMKLVSSLLGTVIDVGVLALIVIFQPEIRRFLFRFGRNSRFTKNNSAFLNKLLGLPVEKMDAEVAKEISEACKEMSAQKTGALIVIPRKNSLAQVIETGDKIDAIVSKRLIMNIFFKNSPLHDGAMIIKRDRICAARCTLPMTDRNDIAPRYGMRHKSAIGLSEEYDANVVVVSEETGEISFVKSGEIETMKSINRLKALLQDSLGEEQEEIQND